MNRDVLYVTYDGLLDPIGRSQVVPHLVGLSARGWRMIALSYEKPNADLGEVRALGLELEARGVQWIRRRYHKRPTVPATAFDLGTGWLATLDTSVRRRLACVHARSYVSASIALAACRLSRAPLLFDMRGFWADEKIESGAWRRGLLYRGTKRVERLLFDASAAVVSLTEAGKRELETWPSVGGRGVPISVIPTCADLSLYRGLWDLDRRPAPLTIGYIGSFGGRYLIEDAVSVFREIRALIPEARLHVLTPREQGPLRDACRNRGVPASAVTVEAVKGELVPGRLATFDATICLIKPGFASLASCPTKFGESLAAGCPVVVNEGVGDCADIVARERVGTVASLDPATHSGAARALLALLEEGRSLRRRCHDVAERLLAMDRAIDEYDRIYTRLGDR